MKAYGALVAYIGTIIAANWAVATFGVIPVGFGLVAPAAVVFAGLALSMRDVVQDRLGRRAVLLAIIVGAALSATISPTFAFASGTAFLVSETLDMLIYTPVRQRNWYAAVAASNVVGLVADSVIFLTLAFGSLAFLPGQIIGKLEVTVAFLAITAVWRARAVLPRNRPA